MVRSRCGILLLYIMLSSCGPKSPGENVSEENAASVFAETVCDAIGTCDCALAGTEPWNSCEEQLESYFSAWQENAIRDGSRFDPACLQRHLDDRARHPCAPTERCAIYHGTDEIGASCESHDPAGFFSTCQPEHECPRFLGYCVERSALDMVPMLELGQQCLDESSNVSGLCSFSELYCNFTAPVPRCEERVPLGGDCDIDAACVEGSHCSASGCIADKPDDATCLRRAQCSSFSCNEGKCVEPLPVPDGCAYLLP